MRAIIVGTTYIESGWYRSMSCERALGVELAAEHDVVAREQRGHRPDERTVVVQRAGHQVRAVESASAAAARRRDRSCPAGSPTISFGRPVEPPDVIAFHGFDTASGNGASSKPSTASGASHDDARLGELDDRVELALGKPRRHGLRRRAELPARDRGRDELDRVRQRDRDAGRRPARPCACERAGGAVRERLELGARHRAVLVGDREMIGIGRRRGRGAVARTRSGPRAGFCALRAAAAPDSRLQPAQRLELLTAARHSVEMRGDHEHRRHVALAVDVALDDHASTS